MGCADRGCAQALVSIAWVAEYPSPQSFGSVASVSRLFGHPESLVISIITACLLCALCSYLQPLTGRFMFAAIRRHSASIKSRARICASVSGLVVVLDDAKANGLTEMTFVGGGISPYNSLDARYRSHAGHGGWALCSIPRLSPAAQLQFSRSEGSAIILVYTSRVTGRWPSPLRLCDARCAECPPFPLGVAPQLQYERGMRLPFLSVVIRGHPGRRWHALPRCASGDHPFGGPQSSTSVIAALARSAPEQATAVEATRSPACCTRGRRCSVVGEE